MNEKSAIRIDGIVGTCGSAEVFMGFAPANSLFSLSFADVLNEDTGDGYQRPHSARHSLDFRSYIVTPGSSTIPLTFNLRPELADRWHLERGETSATLTLSREVPCLAQVDCQHRLGALADVDVPLAFMTFIGLSLRDEMRLFVVINSKARGLSSSLTDFHQTTLLDQLAQDAPHLYLTRRLNEDPASPWYRQIKCGGSSTSGLRRRTSFRMMQRSLARYLARNKHCASLEQHYSAIVSFWQAIATLFQSEWADPRHHLLTKGVGVYALTMLMADLATEAPPDFLTTDHFLRRLQPLQGRLDWRSDGAFSNVGGQKGATAVFLSLKEAMQP